MPTLSASASTPFACSMVTRVPSVADRAASPVTARCTAGWGQRDRGPGTGDRGQASGGTGDPRLRRRLCRRVARRVGRRTRHDGMNTFPAVVATGQGPATVQQLSESDLPEGDVTVAVSYSSLNYKDGLAGSGKGKI